jgi:hypothetical protein
MGLHYSRGLLDLALGRNEEALADFQAGERLAPTLVTPNILAMPVRAHMLQTLLRPGQTERVEAALAALDEHERGDPKIRATLASLRLAQHDPQAATALAPVIDTPSGPSRSRWWRLCCWRRRHATRSATRPPPGAPWSGALDLAGPNSVLMAFLIHPAPELLERHSRQRTARAVPDRRGPEPARRGGGDQGCPAGDRQAAALSSRPAGFMSSFPGPDGGPAGPRRVTASGPATPAETLLAAAVPAGRRESPKHVTPAHQAGREAAQV